MVYVVFDPLTQLLHFSQTFTRVEDAANEVYAHVQEAPYEYARDTELLILSIIKDASGQETVMMKPVARIDICQRAWLCIRHDNTATWLILPKYQFKRRLPNYQKIVIWNFTKQILHDHVIYPTLKSAINQLGEDAQSGVIEETEDVFGLLSAQMLKTLLDEHSGTIPESATLYHIEIKKSAWLTYLNDQKKHRILLPISARARRRRNQKTT